ncbi:hypothetical protein BDZ90DRAFT_275206 [Jaminaea rosea]|uniref:Uncharacterized protein n=1 Tax=Jaminaea rosea TaxID=1569628 RepID=A0A316UQ39_9BASI|nr:hypothetical protein BDZ90DRAFT_275206 [Jaminaea rosea]PWN26421.1 hypothetical protein BDZ90DRAFT_275206 [Jaminaea rosea]
MPLARLLRPSAASHALLHATRPSFFTTSSSFASTSSSASHDASFSSAPTHASSEEDAHPSWSSSWSLRLSQKYQFARYTLDLATNGGGPGLASHIRRRLMRVAEAELEEGSWVAAGSVPSMPKEAQMAGRAYHFGIRAMCGRRQYEEAAQTLEDWLRFAATQRVRDPAEVLDMRTMQMAILVVAKLARNQSTSGVDWLGALQRLWDASEAAGIKWTPRMLRATSASLCAAGNLHEDRLGLIVEILGARLRLYWTDKLAGSSERADHEAASFEGNPRAGIGADASHVARALQAARLRLAGDAGNSVLLTSYLVALRTLARYFSRAYLPLPLSHDQATRLLYHEVLIAFPEALRYGELPPLTSPADRLIAADYRSNIATFLDWTFEPLNPDKQRQHRRKRKLPATRRKRLMSVRLSPYFYIAALRYVYRDARDGRDEGALLRSDVVKGILAHVSRNGTRDPRVDLVLFDEAVRYRQHDSAGQLLGLLLPQYGIDPSAAREEAVFELTRVAKARQDSPLCRSMLRYIAATGLLDSKDGRGGLDAEAIVRLFIPDLPKDASAPTPTINNATLAPGLFASLLNLGVKSGSFILVAKTWTYLRALAPTPSVAEATSYLQYLAALTDKALAARNFETFEDRREIVWEEYEKMRASWQAEHVDAQLDVRFYRALLKALGWPRLLDAIHRAGGSENEAARTQLRLALAALPQLLHLGEELAHAAAQRKRAGLLPPELFVWFLGRWGGEVGRGVCNTARMAEEELKRHPRAVTEGSEMRLGTAEDDDARAALLAYLEMGMDRDETRGEEAAEEEEEDEERDEAQQRDFVEEGEVEWEKRTTIAGRWRDLRVDWNRGRPRKDREKGCWPTVDQDSVPPHHPSGTHTSRHKALSRLQLKRLSTGPHVSWGSSATLLLPTSPPLLSPPQHQPPHYISTGNGATAQRLHPAWFPPLPALPARNSGSRSKSSLRRTPSSTSSGTSSTGSSLLCYTSSGISAGACSTGSSCSSLSSLAISHGQPAPARSQADSCPACEVAHISQCSAAAAPESVKRLRQTGVDLRPRCTSLVWSPATGRRSHLPDFFPPAKLPPGTTRGMQERMGEIDQLKTSITELDQRSKLRLDHLDAVVAPLSDDHKSLAGKDAPVPNQQTTMPRQQIGLRQSGAKNVTGLQEATMIEERGNAESSKQSAGAQRQQQANFAAVATTRSGRAARQPRDRHRSSDSHARANARLRERERPAKEERDDAFIRGVRQRSHQQHRDYLGLQKLTPGLSALSVDAASTNLLKKGTKERMSREDARKELRKGSFLRDLRKSLRRQRRPFLQRSLLRGRWNRSVQGLLLASITDGYEEPCYSTLQPRSGDKHVSRWASRPRNLSLTLPTSELMTALERFRSRPTGPLYAQLTDNAFLYELANGCLKRIQALNRKGANLPVPARLDLRADLAAKIEEQDGHCSLCGCQLKLEGRRRREPLPPGQLEVVGAKEQQSVAEEARSNSSSSSSSSSGNEGKVGIASESSDEEGGALLMPTTGATASSPQSSPSSSSSSPVRQPLAPQTTAQQPASDLFAIGRARNNLQQEHPWRVQPANASPDQTRPGEGYGKSKFSMTRAACNYVKYRHSLDEARVLVAHLARSWRSQGEPAHTVDGEGTRTLAAEVVGSAPPPSEQEMRSRAAGSFEAVDEGIGGGRGYTNQMQIFDFFMMTFHDDCMVLQWVDRVN